MKLHTLIITIAIALITAAALAGDKPRIEITATGGAMYVVVVDGEQVSQHTTLHKALEMAGNAAFADLAAEVRVRRNAEWRVVAMGWEPGDPHTPQPPPDEPEPDPITEPDEPSRPAEGFTVFEPSDDTLKVYVSSSQGDDANDGLSPDTPKRTIAAGYRLLRDGHPDWLLLRAGDVWEDEHLGDDRWLKSGRSASERMVVMPYGDRPRPLLKNGTIFNRGGGGAPSSVNHVAFIGIELYATKRDPHHRDFVGVSNIGDPVGVSWTLPGENIRFEDLKVHHYRTGFIFQNDQRNVRLHRCIIIDNHNAGNAHAQGLYSREGSDLHISESTFDHNGWHPDIEGAHPTIHNHNIYLSRSVVTHPFSVRDSIIARGSSHGVNEGHGEIIGNFFARNAIAGYLRQGPTQVRDNVVWQSVPLDRDPASGDRAWGFSMGGSPRDHAGGPSSIIGNIFLDRIGGNSTCPIDPREGANPEWLTVRDNIARDWGRAAWTVEFRNVTEGTFDHGANVMDGKLRDGTEVDFVDHDRRVEDYEGGFEAFLEQARNRERGVWDERYTAVGVNNYIRQGFARDD